MPFSLTFQPTGTSKPNSFSPTLYFSHSVGAVTAPPPANLTMTRMSRISTTTPPPARPAICGHLDACCFFFFFFLRTGASSGSTSSGLGRRAFGSAMSIPPQGMGQRRCRTALVVPSASSLASWFRYGGRAQQAPGASCSPAGRTGGGRRLQWPSRAPEATDRERVPVLRVPGHRPPLEPTPDGRTPSTLHPPPDHADELHHRIPLGRLPRQPGRPHGEVLRRLRLRRQLGHAPLHGAPAAPPARRGRGPAVCRGRRPVPQGRARVRRAGLHLARGGRR